MNQRPRIKIELTIIDKTAEILSAVILMAVFVVAGISYNSLPETIPIHFNASGEVDGYGGKVTLFFIPVIGVALFVLLTVLNNFPHIFNYPTPITSENAASQYRFATRFIRFLKLSMCLIFLLITIKMVQAAKGEIEGLGSWFLPVTMGITLIPVAYMLVKYYSDRKRNVL